MPDGFLTTHVLDTARGLPAAGMKIDLFAITDGQSQHLVTKWTNADGRTDGPILPADQFKAGQYELLFYAGDYFDQLEIPLPTPKFLSDIPIRFGIADETSHYHVPLLCSPYGFSTYRGS